MAELNLKTLEEYLDKYPWYSGGYLELYRRLSGTAISRELLSKVSARIYSRELLYRILLGQSPSGTIVSVNPPELTEEEYPSFSTDIDEVELDSETEVVAKFVLAGGDYFSRKDLEQLNLDRDKPLDRFIEDRPSLLRSALDNNRNTGGDRGEETVHREYILDDDAFYTETLASIYENQGHYGRALDIYAKLILLYPEKSSYFATLVKDIKNKYNL